jgi:hypothetical protein
MSGRGRLFFATASDLLPGLARFEQLHPVQYVESGLFDIRTPRVWSSGSAIPNLGRAPSGQAITEPAFLVMFRQSPVVVRDVPQRAGGVKYAVDQLENPDSTVIWTGGLFSPAVLVSGSVATIGATDTARTLQKDMARTVTRGFRRIGVYWLGPDAVKLFEAGARLTWSVQSPPEYDLRIEGGEP